MNPFHRAIGETSVMAFGQQAGPPASAKQVRELLAFLQDAGHSDFRDARGPMGFTQRQAAGKFTRDEATAFIDQLQEAVDDGRGGRPPASAPKSATPYRDLSRIPASQLAAELQRRGWTVITPHAAPEPTATTAPHAE